MCKQEDFRQFTVIWIEHESPICNGVEGSLLYQNPLSVNSVHDSFSRFTTWFISDASVMEFQEFQKKKKQ